MVHCFLLPFSSSFRLLDRLGSKTKGVAGSFFGGKSLGSAFFGHLDLVPTSYEQAMDSTYMCKQAVRDGNRNGGNRLLEERATYSEDIGIAQYDHLDEGQSRTADLCC